MIEQQGDADERGNRADKRDPARAGCRDEAQKQEQPCADRYQHQSAAPIVMAQVVARRALVVAVTLGCQRDRLPFFQRDTGGFVPQALALVVKIHAGEAHDAAEDQSAKGDDHSEFYAGDAEDSREG